MIKLHASYSKKIPGEEQYSSLNYHASLEIEVADDVARDAATLQTKLRTLWSDLEQAVEAQIANGNGAPATAESGPSMTDGPVKASPRQINYLTLLARRSKGWGLAELEEFIKSRFGNGGVYELGKSEASMLIEEFRGMTGQGSRR